MWRRVWIWKRKVKKGVTYCVRWRDKRGRIRSESIGSDRKLAERMRTEREMELNRGSLDNQKPMRFDDFAASDVRTQTGRIAARSVVELERTFRHFRRLCSPEWLTDIDLAMVEEFFSARLGEVAKATANKEVRTMKAAFNRAVRRGYLRENPGRYVKLVRVPEKTLRVLSPEEVGILLGACLTDRWRAFIALAVTTGMRRGELLALPWRDVELDSLTVHVRNTPEHETKSGKVRVLALRPHVAELLALLDQTTELVFHTDEGTSMANNVERGFNALVKRSGIERCTMHDLRRTFVSHLAMAGVSASVVQKLAGHASISTTVKHYTQIMPEALREAQSRLPFDDAILSVSYVYRESEKHDSPQSGKVIRLFPQAS
jgi:integrase